MRVISFNNIIFKNRKDKYPIRAGYTLKRIRGITISQRLPCPVSSEVLFGWKSC